VETDGSIKEGIKKERKLTDTVSQFVIGQGFKDKIAELNLTPLSNETYFSPDCSMVLTDHGPLWYSKPANVVVGPFGQAPEP